MMKFNLQAPYEINPVQKDASLSLADGILKNLKFETLLGVTGSGKTFTVANVINEIQKPTLVMVHNKTLAAQLYNEFKNFFPKNAIEYFVSYYDYYQPESYSPKSDTYIEKDAKINEEIERLRHSATFSLLERLDTIVVSSVSAIYGLGDPEDYKKSIVSIRKDAQIDRDDLIRKLVASQYERNEIEFTKGKFRARGDVLEIFPASFSENAIGVHFFGNTIEKIIEFSPITGKDLSTLTHVAIFPASHYVSTEEKLEVAIKEIEKEMKERIFYFENQNKQVEAQRIKTRTCYDIEMLRETGFCQGIENYSRIISNRTPGSAPYTLIDYFPKDYLLVIDESHVTIPQIRSMFAGDKARKTNLIEHGFRLPSAFDNRPLDFEEFYEKINQAIFVSATPGEFEARHSEKTVEQIIRPTGLLDPIIEVKNVENQVIDLSNEIKKRIEKKEKVLATVLTKKMAEKLTNYLEENDFRVRYLHSEVKTLERIEIIKDLRSDVFDVLIGINLLREGLDIPEVSLVAILNCDKEGFLRSRTSLIQTIGRAARNSNGKVIMYAEKITESMEYSINETKRRREMQIIYNKKHGIIPTTVKKSITESISVKTKIKENEIKKNVRKSDKCKTLNTLKKKMQKAAKELNFELAAELRDKIKIIEQE